MYGDSCGVLARSRVFDVRRRDPRYVSSIPLTLQRSLRFGTFLTRAVSLDISARGMSALVCGAPRVGEIIVISFSLPHGSIETPAIVRHSSDTKTGFEFHPLSRIVQKRIQAWIDELKQHEESLFPFPYASAAKPGSD